MIGEMCPLQRSAHRDAGRNCGLMTVRIGGFPSSAHESLLLVAERLL